VGTGFKAGAGFVVSPLAEVDSRCRIPGACVVSER
jgi:hypothetical protein